MPLLSLAKRTDNNKTIGTGPHKVKMLKDAEGKKLNQQIGKKVDGIWFLMEENGQKVKYFVPYLNEDGQVHYLLERLGTVPEDSEIILEYKTRKGTFRGYIDVQMVETETLNDDSHRNNDNYRDEEIEEEIPIIETDEDNTKIPDEPF